MSWLFRRRRDRDRELNEEIGAHLKMAILDRVRRGESVEDATAAVRREFGNVGAVKEVTRGTWAWAWVEPLAQDMRYALRGLAKSPGFAAAIALTFALGVGANSAIFSLIDREFVQAPPGIPGPGQLRHLDPFFPAFPNMNGLGPSFRRDQAQAIRSEVAGVASVAGFDAWCFPNGCGDERAQVRAVRATSDFLPVIVARPGFGRFFTEDEDRNHAKVAVISHDF